MAMIQCTECGKEAFSNVTTCPHCGIQVSKKRKQAVNISYREGSL